MDGLKTHIETRNGVVKAVDGISFSVHQGEIVGLVGESGCGKTMTSLSIMGLVPAPSGRIVAGSIRFAGKELVGLGEREMRAIRGRDISMMLQDPLTSLNPVFTIGNQVAESFIFHRRKGEAPRSIKDKVVEVLQRVRIASPERFFSSYPHQFSGGMRQRVSAAIAIAPQPKLMIADEPMTALDVTTQAQFLQLLRQLRSETDLSIIYITHDLGVVARLCSRVIVMYAGHIVESGAVGAIYKSPAHPYTRGLMNSVPRLGASRGRLFQIEGQAPHLQNMPPGCPFHPRCREAQDICRQELPPMTDIAADGHRAACWFPQKTPLNPVS
ncbi:ABC transporter ATP-binding protein [Bosea caraganae]|uniref:ABC transporter ATP-binding protein n=1 Tax=Bosea caraganae TaxID=2763117 RepID=UPI001FEC55FC|nr:ABC transporter ATP-binding protein [Bosea caraganae]